MSTTASDTPGQPYKASASPAAASPISASGISTPTKEKVPKRERLKRMLTSKLRMPGAWDESRDDKSRRDLTVPRTQPDNLIAGIINESGNVVDDTGRAVARITGDLPLDSVIGHVVTATGHILGETGDVVGHVLPLEGAVGALAEGDQDNGEGSQQQSGLLGGILDSTTQTVTGLTGAVGNTLGQTVNSVTTLLPVSNELTQVVLSERERGARLVALPSSEKDDQQQQQQQQQQRQQQQQLEPEKEEEQEPQKPEDQSAQGLQQLEPQQEQDDQPQQLEQDQPEQLESKEDEDEQPTGGELVRTQQDETPAETTETEPTPIEVKDKELGGGDRQQEALPPAETERLKEIEGPKEEDAKSTVSEKKDNVLEEAKSTVPEEKEEIPADKEEIPEEAKSTIPEDKEEIPEEAKSTIPEDKEEIPEEAKSTIPEEKEEIPEEAKSTIPEEKDEKPEEEEEKEEKLEDEKSAVPEDKEEKPEEEKSIAPEEEDKKPDEDKSEAPEEDKDIPEGSQAPGSELPKSEVPEAEVPSSQLPEGSIAPEESVSAQLEMPPPFANFPDAHVTQEGKVVAGEGSKLQSIGVLAEGDAGDLQGRHVDEEGNIVNETGTVVGHAELKEELREELRREAEEEAKKKAEEQEEEDRLKAEQQEEEDRLKAEEQEEQDRLKAEEDEKKAEEEAAEKKREAYAILKGATVNKGGNLVNDKGQAVGRLVEGILSHCIGRKSNENGEIWNDSGKVMARAEPIPETELEDYKEPAPFEDFEGAVVESDGRVMYLGEQIGIVVEGDPKKLKGKKVDPDGEILDKNGNVLGRAERWEPEPEAEPEPEPEVDRSILAGKRVNKAGNLVDSGGSIFGRVVEGDINRLVGRMSDRDGNIRSESGDILGRAEVIPEGEREGFKEGPFAELPGCTVAKDGKVVTPSGDVVGRLVSGDPKVLFGRAVDEDGDILDRNGNSLGKAERWEEPEPEPEPEKVHGPMFGRKVNREGNVVDEDGNVIGKLTTGDLSICAGKTIDDDNDVVDAKGSAVGHVTLIQDIPEPEPEKEHGPLYGRRVNREGNVVDQDGNIIGKLTTGEVTVCSGKSIDDDGDVVDSKGTSIGHVSLITDLPKEEEPVETETEEEKAKREEAEQDRKLAKQMASAVEQCLDRIRPICKMITSKIDTAERTPKDELDEEELVKQVKPLIEEGGKILTEANGVIRALDPDGHIQANAKSKAHTRDATPEEFHLADVLKELTGTVSECIDNAKRKIEGMPHAKKELNPLWGLLTEPLFQILAAVGLLLNGVLELVGRLLGGLGLGGIVNNLLGGLGLTNVLKSLGIGGVVDAITGKKQTGAKQGGKIGILGL